MFSNLSDYKEIDDRIINEAINNLYKTNFFENISINYNSKEIKIKVIESPIIEKISIKGIKAKNKDIIEKIYL